MANGVKRHRVPRNQHLATTCNNYNKDIIQNQTDKPSTSTMDGAINEEPPIYQHFLPGHLKGLALPLANAEWDKTGKSEWEYTNITTKKISKLYPPIRQFHPQVWKQKNHGAWNHQAVVTQLRPRTGATNRCHIIGPIVAPPWPSGHIWASGPSIGAEAAGRWAGQGVGGRSREGPRRIVGKSWGLWLRGW